MPAVADADRLLTTRDALVAAVLASPQDDTPKLVLADWLDENGDPDTSYAYRWAVRNNKSPQPPGPHDWWQWHFGDLSLYPGCGLTMVLEHGMSQGRHRHSRHTTYDDAMHALGVGLRRLRDILDAPGAYR